MPNEEELLEGQEPEELEGEEELDTEVPEEPEGDSEIFEVTYKTTDGQDVREEYTPQQIADLVMKAKRGNPEIDDFLRQSTTILDAFQQSELIREVAAYRAMGYSDEQIKQGMAQIMGQAKEAAPEPKQFDNVEEELEYKLNQKMAAVITPLAQKLEKQELEIKAERIANKNNNLIEKALGKRGLSSDDLTQEDTANLVSSFYALWPHANMAFSELSPKQAAILVNDAMRNRGKNRAGSKIKNAMAPGAIPVQGSVSVSRLQKRGPTRPKDGTSIEDRQRNVKNFLG